MAPLPTSDIPLNIALLHPNEGQRTMLSKAIKGFDAQLKSAASWSDLASHQLALGGVWVLFDIGDATAEVVQQIRSAKQQAFWGILILGQAPVSEQQPLISLGADAYLAYPFDLPALKGQISQITSHRAPVGVFNVLPPQIASGLDRVWARFEHLSYYELLELSPISTPEEIQARFHQRSLVLHPDRHRGMKRTHPPVYERVNLIYKRLLEGYRVLTDDLQRPLYDAALVSGLKRWNYLLVERKKEIMNTTESPEAQVLLARALSMRSRGLLKISCQILEHLCRQEPTNEALKRLSLGYDKLINLARRDPQIAGVIDQQLAPEGLF